MSRESSLWVWLSKARPAFGDALHMGRIENSLEAGTPDVEGMLGVDHGRFFDGEKITGQFWIELKSSERPLRSTTPVRFKLRGREAQIEWMRRRWELGGNAFFLLQVGSGANRILYLAPGDLGARLQQGITEGELAVHCTGTGVFTKHISQESILKRVVTCRKSPYRSCHFPS